MNMNSHLLPGQMTNARHKLPGGTRYCIEKHIILTFKETREKVLFISFYMSLNKIFVFCNALLIHC